MLFKTGFDCLGAAAFSFHGRVSFPFQRAHQPGSTAPQNSTPKLCSGRHLAQAPLREIGRVLLIVLDLVNSWIWFPLRLDRRDRLAKKRDPE